MDEDNARESFYGFENTEEDFEAEEEEDIRKSEERYDNVDISNDEIEFLEEIKEIK